MTEHSEPTEPKATTSTRDHWLSGPFSFQCLGGMVLGGHLQRQSCIFQAGHPGDCEMKARQAEVMSVQLHPDGSIVGWCSLCHRPVEIFSWAVRQHYALVHPDEKMGPLNLPHKGDPNQGKLL